MPLRKVRRRPQASSHRCQLGRQGFLPIHNHHHHLMHFEMHHLLGHPPACATTITGQPSPLHWSCQHEAWRGRGDTSHGSDHNSTGRRGQPPPPRRSRPDAATRTCQASMARPGPHGPGQSCHHAAARRPKKSSPPETAATTPPPRNVAAEHQATGPPQPRWAQRRAPPATAPPRRPTANGRTAAPRATGPAAPPPTGRTDVGRGAPPQATTVRAGGSRARGRAGPPPPAPRGRGPAALACGGGRRQGRGRGAGEERRRGPRSPRSGRRRGVRGREGREGRGRGAGSG